MYVDVSPTPLVDPLHRFVLFTNAKCGGTTLKSWFFANLELQTLERRPLRFLRTFGAAYAWRRLRSGKAAPSAVDLTDEDQVRRLTNFYRAAFCKPALAAGVDDHFKLAVVRHPEDRVVSAFVDKFCGDDRYEPWVREVVETGGANGEISFNAFLDYLETVDESRCDPHWRRQSYVLEGHRIDAWVRLERLEEDFRRIGPRVGAAHIGVFARKLQSNRYDPALASAAADADMPARGSSEIAAWRARYGAFPPKEAFLTEETRARIRRIYARDFAMLPYDD